MKDLIISSIGDYSYSQVKMWINSIQRSGFSGDVVLISYNSNKELTDELMRRGISVIEVGHDLYGRSVDRFETHSGKVNGFSGENLIHNVRFFHMWQFLNELSENYRFVISSDCRDVVFQKNPSYWLDDYSGNLVCTSEGVLYKDEGWNSNLINKGFGPYVLQSMMNYEICCAGVFAGTVESMKNMFLMVYLMSMRNGYIDQASFNILCRSTNVDITTMNDDWTAHCTLSIGQREKYENLVSFKYPKILDDGLYTHDNKKYYIVHQYDTYPILRQTIERIYS